MTSLTQFTFHNEYNVRIIDLNGELWFVASDVASALDYRMASDMTRFLDDDEKGTHNLRTPSGSQDLTIINESGLYSAILKSRKPEAKKFKKWVTSEVLPSIRKTGKYEAPKPITPRNYINNNDMLNIKRLIWCCAGHLDQKQSVSSAIWYSLRNVTGVPSPAKFEVEHLPVLAQEFNRILSIIEPYLKARYACEEALIKRLLRDREDAQSLLTKLLDEMKESTSEFNTALQKQLPMVFQGDCLNLVERKPCGIDHHEFNRWA
ncbi:MULTISPECIES: BRO family protein [Acinetobacter]|uniref:Bro-N domain-containing protein n=7 Tax=Acinetobacter calcoaceticus/baumannii complex TaxID=909768 RepID=N8S8I6_9GAMM|nr:MULTISPECIES: BRO family protein [Acinetobacter]EHU2142681.1 Bro-N domain-containing protein [Acinetobacter baumannii]EHU2653734.1 Bro-N domain-containing protein [Acinetobacter baumannii]EHU2721884.1 Bro-N domain-containing protein [Acinetobacter baumannii]EHU2840265.1 Bro-N domain-containing protein [Acinetobacter baumannii]EHU3379560.1 Bro-N domain-containing protein [Acinetobacter baumannii]